MGRLSNAEKCKRRREKLKAEDPERWEKERQQDRERCRQRRQKPKTEEQLQHQRKLGAERQKRYLERKKAEKALKAAQGVPSPRKTRLDEEKKRLKREANCRYIQKYRAQMHPQKRRRVNEKRMERYYSQKRKREEERQRAQAVQTEEHRQSSDCPYPTPEAYRKAVQRFKARMGVQGTRLAHLIKGVIKHSNKKTKASLKNLNVTYKSPSKPQIKTPTKTLKEHLQSISSKRDKSSLTFKRNLLGAFSQQGADVSQIGLKKAKQSRQLYYRKKTFPGKAAIERFYDENSVPDPCKSSKKRQLQKPLKQLHRDFVHEYPHVKVSLRSFHRLKPRDVASVKKLKFRQCMCEICMNPKMKLMRLNMLMERKCEGVKELLIESVCKFDAFPRKECVDRKCSDCGIERVRERLEKMLEGCLDQNVSWKKWEHVKEGKTSRIDRVKKNGSVRECLREMTSELNSLYRHTFNADWQRKQLQLLKADLPEGWAIAYLDFAENFLCKFQEEVQSAHWAYKQVSLFPSVLFFRCQACPELQRDELAFFSDDLLKDAAMSQACIQKVLDHLQERMGGGMKKLILVSDGCAAQFKSKLPFLHLSQTQTGNPELTVERVYFGSRHGKNDSDWSGGAIKRSVTRDLASGRVCVRNAGEMFTHCVNTLTLGNTATDECQHKTRNFVLLGEVDRTIKSSSVSTLRGSRKLHHLRVLEPFVLATRQLTCFCEKCRVGSYDECTLRHHVGEWEIVKLKCTADVNPPVPSESESDSDDQASAVPVLSDSSTDRENEPEWCSEDEPESEADEFSSEEGEVPCVQAVPGATKRRTFFQQALSSLSECRSFSEITDVARNLAESVQSFPLPEPSSKNVLGAQIDHVSSALLHEEIKNKVVVLSVEGDGNCFYRSLSLLLFGCESHHVELRVRCAIVMALNADLFLRGENWVADHEMIEAADVVEICVLTAAQCMPSPELTFQTEVQHMVKNGSYAGIWEFFAASFVLQRPIQSVFPVCGEEPYRLHCNRIIQAPNCVHKEKLHIMWTSLEGEKTANQATWSPNHFVPLVLRRPVKGPKTGNFHKLKWNGRELVGLVMETDEMLELACVKFMEQNKQGFFIWPVRDDFSWEPFSSFLQEVQLNMVEDLSRNRCQVFVAN